MDRGVRLGVDVGTVRVGVAASDPEGILAFPVETVQRNADAVARVAQIAAEREAIDVFVGLPRHMSGAEGASAADARNFAGELAELLLCPVRLIDERLSTASASQAMRAAGRNARKQRDSIDQAAAVVILDTALDAARKGNLSTVAPRVALKENDD